MNEPSEPQGSFDSEQPVQENQYKLIKSGRFSIILVGLLSAVNIILILVDSPISFPFSLSFPKMVTAVCAVMGESTRSQLPVIISVIVGFIISGLFIYFYFVSAKFFCSKKPLWAMWASVIIFSVDTVLLLVLITLARSESYMFFIDVAFHGWALYSMIRMLLAARTLSTSSSS